MVKSLSIATFLAVIAGLIAAFISLGSANAATNITGDDGVVRFSTEDCSNSLLLGGYNDYQFTQTRVLLSHDAGGANIGPEPVSIAAGTYWMDALSFDDHSGSGDVTQDNETYYVEFLSGGQIIATSPLTDDVLDGQDFQASTLGQVTLPADVDQIRWVHGAVATTGFDASYQSVFPTCFNLTAVAEPTPTPTPEPTPTATPTPTPTIIVDPSPTPEPTATPVQTPTATPTPEPTQVLGATDEAVTVCRDGAVVTTTESQVLATDVVADTCPTEGAVLGASDGATLADTGIGSVASFGVGLTLLGSTIATSLPRRKQ